MSLSDEEKSALMQLQLEKGASCLEQADKVLELGMYDNAMNRYYYACFHVVMALFIKEGINAHRHRGMLIQFSLHFVKTGRISTSMGAILFRLEQMREAADYNCHYNVTEEEVLSIQPKAKEFYETIVKLIKE